MSAYKKQLKIVRTLYHALAMAGAGQVGAAIALYQKAKRIKHSRLCSVISGALPAGFLGVGEPLIYGVTLPMGRPFITAGLGAGFGGAFAMFCQVASTTWGPSGLLGIFVMTAGPNGAARSSLMYLIGLFISYAMSYVITKALISDKEVAELLGGISIGGETAEPQEGAKEDGEFSGNGYVVVHHGDAVSFESEEVICFEHIIRNSVGIHARPAGELAKLIAGFDCDVTIRNGEKTASGKSAIGLMMLDASKGSRLEFSVKGKNARKAAESLEQYVNEKL